MGLFDFFKKEEEKQPEWLSMIPKEMANMFLSEIRNNPQACKLDEIPQGIGNFGLDKTNPVPVYGVPENEIYLSKLRLSNGDRIRWRRIKSLEIASINKPIDEYEIFNMNGDTITLLYISPYHLKTSSKAPAGFKIV
jgi:hypothetical protein